jgi:hypothetical protein
LLQARHEVSVRMHELEPEFFTLGSLPIYSYSLRLTATAFFVFPFGIPEGCRYTLEVHASRLPCWLYLVDLLGERKEFHTVIADLTEILEDRVAGGSRSRWLQKVRRQGCLEGIRNDARPAALAPQGKVLTSLSVPNNSVSRRRNRRAFSDAGIDARFQKQE